MKPVFITTLILAALFAIALEQGETRLGGVVVGGALVVTAGIVVGFALRK